ncbi:MAG: lipoprotein [Microbacteriaceae bacterium]|nr:lipoprotein [Microbacteriaceae bacterium]
MAAQRTSKHPTAAVIIGAAIAIVALSLTGCSSQGASITGRPSASQAAPTPHSTEVNPSGDIPDNQAYVAFTASDGAFSVKVPEGWARTSSGSMTSFTDKLNMITLDQKAASAAPTVASAKQGEVVALSSSEPKFTLTDVKTFTRAGGGGIMIAFQSDSPVNPVTGSVVRNEVEQYLFWKGGQQVSLTLTSPKGSDNVDPWAQVTGSFRWLTK